MKGVSPLIAFVVLIAMSVSILMVVSGWYADLFSSSQRRIGNTTHVQVDCMSAELAIQDVYLDFAANRSRATIKNTGYADDRIADAGVWNQAGERAPTLTALPANLSKGDTMSIEFDITNVVPACGNFSKLIVTSVCRPATFDAPPKGC